MTPLGTPEIGINQLARELKFKTEVNETIILKNIKVKCI
jgi:hypothetical protein